MPVSFCFSTCDNMALHLASVRASLLIKQRDEREKCLCAEGLLPETRGQQSAERRSV